MGRFGGGPAVNHLYVCSICQVEIEALAKRRRIEIDTFIKVGMGSTWEQGRGQAGKWRPGKLLPVLQNVSYSTAWGCSWDMRMLCRQNL